MHLVAFSQSWGFQVQLKFGQKTEMVGGEHVIGKAIHRPQDVLGEEGEGTNQLQALVRCVIIG